jgi:hypothetical protein
MSGHGVDLRTTVGYVVADARGRTVGRVECPLFGRSPDVPDALAVRSGFRRHLVPAESIEQVDDGTRLVGLRVERDSIRRLL